MEKVIAETGAGTEQRILEAARRVFLRKGYAGARMQEIADEAGINKAMVHYYYRSKDKLFEEIFSEAFATLLPAVAHVFMGPGSLDEKIGSFTEKYVSVMQAHPYIPVFVLSEMHRNPDSFFQKFIRPELKNAIKGILGLMDRAVQQGEIRQMDARHLLMNLLSLCVFPFVAKPMLQRMLDITEEEFAQLMEERKQVISTFVIQAITPKHTA